MSGLSAGGQGDAAGPLLRFELRLLQERHSGIPLWLLLAGVIGLTYAKEAGLPRELFWGMAGLLVLVSMGWLLWQRRRRGEGDQPAFVELYADRLRLPGGRGGGVDVPFPELENLQLLGGPGPMAVLRVGEKGRLHALVLARREAELLYREALERLAQLPGGDLHARALLERARLGGVALAIRPVFTWGTIALLLAAFGIETLALTRMDPEWALIRLGVNDPVLVRAGQLYRVVTANLLHAGGLHILINSASLLSLGGYVERLVGRAGYAAIFMGSAVVGAAASAATQQNLSLGASTAVFGLLGAAGWLHLRHRRSLPAGFLIPRSIWLFNLGSIVLLSVSIPGIDHAAHAGGLIGGLAMGALVAGAARELPLGEAREGFRRGLAVALGALCLISVLWLAKDAVSPTFREKVLAAHGNAGGPTEVLNALAWYVAVDRAASAGELARAEQVARRAVDQVQGPDRAACLDTLAMVLYRRGRFDEAVVTEWDALALHEGEVYFTQLARFLAARGEAAPLFTTPEAADATASGTTQDGQATVSWWSPAGAQLYLVATDGKRIRGLVCLAVQAGESEQQVAVPWRWPAELRLGLIGPEGAPCQTVPFDARAAEWP